MNVDYESMFIDDNYTCDLTIFQGLRTKSQQQNENQSNQSKRFRLNKDISMEYFYDYDLENEIDNEIKQKNTQDSEESNNLITYQDIAYNTLRNALTRSPVLSASPSSSSSSSSLSSSLSLTCSPDKQDSTMIDSDFYKNFENLLNSKPINKMFKYNLDDSLNLTRKDTLIYLIERNISNGILAPFDQYAYFKLQTKSSNNQATIENKHVYNYYNIRKISKLTRTYNVEDRHFLKHNNLMPSCVSALLMPFFFDIFNMSELNLLGDKTVKIMLNLKKYHIAQKYLDELTLISCVSENLVWNCLALFKLKQKESNALYYFNFYLTYFYLQIYLEQLSSQMNNRFAIKEEIKRSLNIGFILSHLLDALIMTGLFKHGDYLKFKDFFQEKQRFDHSLEQTYLDNSIKNVSQTAETCFPLKLKNLCRIQIRKNLVNYNLKTLNQLALPESMKNFLVFSEDMDLIFFKKTRLFK